MKPTPTLDSDPSHTNVCHNTVIIRWLGKQPYESTWQAMKQFTDQRHEQTVDEIWLLEHDPVFTQGQNGKAEHVLNSIDIPIVKTDRGGQITYHGPGQLMVYILIDIKRKKLSIRKLVTLLEQSMIEMLAAYQITAFAKCEAPGVYTAANQKIASIGLRIRRGCTYHGVALNIDMDLSPFQCINPCGFKELQMTQLADYYKHPVDVKMIGKALWPALCKNLHITKVLSFFEQK